MNLTTMIFARRPRFPIRWLGASQRLAAVFAVMVICGIIFRSFLVEAAGDPPPAARIPFNARSRSPRRGPCSHREFLLLALTAAISFCSLACFIGAAPRSSKSTGAWAKPVRRAVLPVITGILPER
jgi:hypothetical protein